MNGLKEFILNWVASMISGFDSNVNGIVSILSTDIFTGNLYTTARNVSTIVEPISLTIITVCFLLEFLKITIRMDILKIEYGLRCVAKFILAKVCIDASFYLLGAIYATGVDWITGIGAIPGSSLGTATRTALTNATASYKWYDALGLVITMALPLLCVWAIGIIVKVIAYARMFELLLYMAISPLPCALLPLEDGGSRIPKKFFLNFAGCCLHGVFIVISIKLYNTICTDTLLGAINGTSNVGDIAYNVLLGSLVLVMAVMKSGQWAKTILDAI